MLSASDFITTLIVNDPKCHRCANSDQSCLNKRAGIRCTYCTKQNATCSLKPKSGAKDVAASIGQQTTRQTTRQSAQDDESNHERMMRIIAAGQELADLLKDFDLDGGPLKKIVDRKIKAFEDLVRGK